MDVRKEDMNEDSKDRARGRRRQHEDDVSLDAGVMEGCCGQGRVWIFLVLGVLALVFSAVLVGVYMNVRALTTSMDSVEVMPSFVPAAAGGVAGLLVLLLFWKRYKILVYGVLVVCAVTVVLCVIAAVLTGTHVLQPLLSVSGCVYSRRDKMCRCFTQFRRDQLELERVADGEQVYLVMQEVSSCADVEDVLPGMLFTMIGVYGVVSLVCVVAGVISLMVYQTEQRRKYLVQQQDLEDDTYSPPSSPSSSDNYAEHHTMLPNHQNSASNATTLVNIYTNPNTTTNDEDNNTNDDGNTTPSDLIYSPSDVPMGYAEACSMRRCQSFSQPRQGLLREGSPGSSTSSQTASLIGGERIMGGAEGGAGKLKEHRKKGRRAVTLHGLDREQLLLILSLQMRYLQESDQSSKREGNNNCINLNNNNVGAAVHDQADSSLLFSQLQRRAMTPTPRQERLSSSRTTDDDLDYRPAKLARSHTPQPYHFKNQNQYAHNINPQPQLQAYQCHPCQQQQKQQQSPQLVNDQDEEEEEEEPPTMITYDLRNVTKTGPIVYENLPSAGSPLSYYNPESQSLNSSPLLPCAAKQPKTVSGLPQASQIKQSPVHLASGTLNQGTISGGHIQGTGSPLSQFSRQSSQVSTASQPSLDSSPSDTRKLVPSKEKTPEPVAAKGKGKKKLSKKEKNLKKEDEAPPMACAQASGLSRTDSNTSKGAAAKTDRWQTLMEDDPRKVTLWENVQRKIVSDPQTPDSTLDLRHPPFTDHQPNLTTHGSNSYISPQIPPGASFQSIHSQKLPQQLNPSQVVPNGILKNPNISSNYLSGAPAVAQKLPSPLNPNQNMHYPNPNPVYTNQQNTLYQNAFIPIANSSTEYYEDIDEVFPAEHQQAYFQGLPPPPPADAHAVGAPPKPPRVFGRQMTKFGTVPSSVQPPIDNQKLRPKSYMNAVDREVVGKAGFVHPSISTSSRSNIPGMDVEHHPSISTSSRSNIPGMGVEHHPGFSTSSRSNIPGMDVEHHPSISASSRSNIPGMGVEHHPSISASSRSNIPGMDVEHHPSISASSRSNIPGMGVEHHPSFGTSSRSNIPGMDVEHHPSFSTSSRSNIPGMDAEHHPSFSTSSRSNIPGMDAEHHPSFSTSSRSNIPGMDAEHHPSISTSSRSNIPGMDVEHHMMTHLLMEGPVKDNINCNAMDKAANECGQMGSNYLYAQSQRRFNPSSELPSVSPDNIYQNAFRHPDGQEQLQNVEQQQHLKAHDGNHPQWSAFQSFNHNQKSGSQVFEYPTVGHEICDTDLDDLPRPRPQRQHSAGQVYSPPNIAVLSMYQSAELVNRPQLIRTGSGSSGEPHNTSCTSSERSGTPTGELQKSFQELRAPDHNWNPIQPRAAGQPANLITDRRFCITQQRQQQQQQQMANQLLQQHAGSLGSQQIYIPEQGQLSGQDQSYMVMRKLHAEERHRLQPPVDISSHRHAVQPSSGTIF